VALKSLREAFAAGRQLEGVSAEGGAKREKSSPPVVGDLVPRRKEGIGGGAGGGEDFLGGEVWTDS